MSLPRLPPFGSGPEAFAEYRKKEAEFWESPEGVALREEKKRKEERIKEQARLAMVGNMASILRFMGIPERTLRAIDAQVEETDATRAVEGASDILVLSGGPGCGKTVAAAVWISVFVKDEKNWSKANDPDLCIHPKMICKTPVWVTAAKLSRWERYESAEMAKLLHASRLVIDDLGGEFLDKGGFYASLLDEIVNERQGASRPTVMTTNLDASAFKERYGERIVDRIREGGRFVGCGNQSLRKKSQP